MEERQVTVDGKTYPAHHSLSCQIIELEGTFSLPEAQLDRFLLKIRLGYPDKDEEMAILERFQEKDPLTELGAVANPEQIAELQQARKGIHVSQPVREYITRLVRATRDHTSLRLGASPRGSLNLMRAGQAWAVLNERNYVLPDDIKYLAVPVLAHRLILKEEERLRGETLEHLLEEIVDRITVPGPTG
jgi:MoxR-like ATPase